MKYSRPPYNLQQIEKAFINLKVTAKRSFSAY